jgi:putative aldouronate transport system substrate-binding protein
VITDKCAKPEVIAAWSDYLYTEEGGRLAWMGVEGETYTIDDKGTYHWNTDGTYGTDMTSIRSKQGLFGNKPVPVKSPALFNEGQANLEELFLFKEREKIKAYGADYFPALAWTDEEIKEKSTLVATINPYFQQYEAKVITGELDLAASWDEYVKTMDNMGLEKLKAIDKAAFDRWLATRFGAAAARLAGGGGWGRMVGLRGEAIVDVPLADAIAVPKRVDPAGETVCTARGIGIVFG